MYCFASRAKPPPVAITRTDNFLFFASFKQEIISSVKDGIYVKAGQIVPDPTSGELSAAVDFGFRIENGRITHPVLNTMVGGEIFGVLERLEAISSDYREEPGNILPTMLIRKVRISGGG